MDNKAYKISVFKKNVKEMGFFSTLIKKIIPFLLRPIISLLKKNELFLEILYGFLPAITDNPAFKQLDSKLIRLENRGLVKEVRKFWYSNIREDFLLDREKIKKKDIFLYGGPNPAITCHLCQKSEWRSRVRQKNLFLAHSCQDSQMCRQLCEKQGDDLWTHFHQNFDFSIGCDSNLPAPKGLYITFDNNNYFLTADCNYQRLVRRRQLAFACQMDVAEGPSDKINWQDYDFLYISLTGFNRKFKRPALPVILEGHDYWGDKTLYQWVINWLSPEILLVPDPARWRDYFKIPGKTKLVLYPLFESNFFARPNLGEKTFDLLVVGSTASSFYQPRIILDQQISEIAPSYKVEFFHGVGIHSINWQGKTYQEEGNQKIRFLNKWSEYLGKSKYVIFGRVKQPGLAGKHYETLGSGAIPIFPEEPDLELLKLKPFEHYIPLSEVEGNNEKLTYFLDNYDKFSYIAQNAVKWYKENSDKMLFSDFEDMIREITNHKYPKRLI